MLTAYFTSNSGQKSSIGYLYSLQRYNFQFSIPAFQLIYYFCGVKINQLFFIEMTSRRLIRIKVLQLLYAYSKKEGVSQAETERDLLKSIGKSTDLYYQILLLLTELRHKAFLKIDAAKNKHFATEDDLHPNTRFIDNPIFSKLSENKKFKSYLLNHPISWNDNMELIHFLYNTITGHPVYKEYMSREEVNFEDHKRFILDIFTEIIAQNEIFFQTLEDINIYWNDDFELVLNVVYKTLKNIKENDAENDNIFYAIYNEAEDLDFAKMLLRKTILEQDENLKIIDKYILNWEIERISDMDKLIMSLALSELKHFPAIPIKVTLDEYIEITKSYSSPKSGPFINGVLDKAVAQLKETEQIHKTGRGLME